MIRPVERLEGSETVVCAELETADDKAVALGILGIACAWVESHDMCFDTDEDAFYFPDSIDMTFIKEDLRLLDDGLETPSPLTLSSSSTRLLSRAHQSMVSAKSPEEYQFKLDARKAHSSLGESLRGLDFRGPTNETERQKHKAARLVMYRTEKQIKDISQAIADAQPSQ